MVFSSIFCSQKLYLFERNQAKNHFPLIGGKKDYFFDLVRILILNLKTILKILCSISTKKNEKLFNSLKFFFYFMENLHLGMRFGIYQG